MALADGRLSAAAGQYRSGISTTQQPIDTTIVATKNKKPGSALTHSPACPKSPQGWDNRDIT
jgi:hypothetical protein